MVYLIVPDSEKADSALNLAQSREEGPQNTSWHQFRFSCPHGCRMSQKPHPSKLAFTLLCSFELAL